MVNEYESVKYEKRSEVPAQKFYLTTAIAYLNGKPHIGHAYEFATADVIARYHKQAGRDVYFLTGSDEHGQKVADTAAKFGKEPLEFCDEMVKRFWEVNEVLNMRPDQYMRSTSTRHKECCSWFWKRAEEFGDIYLGKYEGWYNVKEEAFVTEREAEANGFKDPGSGIAYEKRSEECLFFRLSKYHAEVKDLIKNTDFVVPVSRRNELLQRLDEPLEDLCVSRTALKWGIPVPGHPGHVMYVWYDALVNYLSALYFDAPEKGAGKSLVDYWPANCHLVGKDITWFHCVIWPAMLMSAKIALPRHVFGHGFVQNASGQKMSKSLNNYVDAMETIKIVSSDTFRWYVCREGHYGSDIRFSPEALVDMHNADLCANLGNLVHRSVALCEKMCGGAVPQDEPERLLVDVEAAFNAAEKAMADFALEDLALIGLDISRSANKYLADQAPWKIKDDPVRQRKIIRAVMEAVYVAACFLAPLIPDGAAKIATRFGHPLKPLCQLEKTGANLPPNTRVIPGGEVLYNPLDISAFEATGAAAVPPPPAPPAAVTPTSHK